MAITTWSDKSLWNDKESEHSVELTFLMVYREVAMDMTDMKTMAAA